MTEVPSPHDALFRWTFSHLEDAAALLKSQLPPDLAAQIDWASLQVVSGSFVDDALQGRQADLLFTAELDGAEVLLYVLLEHQSAPDRWMALRLVRYQVRIWERWLRDNPGAKHLPVILPVVLFHGSKPWPAATEFSELVVVPDGLAPALEPHLLRQRFVLDDITNVPEEALHARALTAFAELTLLALSRARDASASAMAAELVRWLRLAQTVATAPSGLQKLRALLQYLVEASEVEESTLARFAAAITAPEEDHPMPTLAEKWKAEGHERGLREGREAGREEGREVGREEGREAGREEGRQAGREEGRVELLLRLLRVKFGDVPQATVSRVRAASPTEVERWSEALLVAPTLEALFGG